MRLSSQLKRVKKLAGAAGVGARCAYCRFALRETFTTGGKVKRDPDKILVTCEWCGTEYSRELPADPVERAVRLEIVHDTIAEAYSTHRKRALHLWAGYHAQVIRPKEKGKQAARRPDAQLTPNQRKRREMIDAFHKLLRTTYARARKSSPKFPDLDAIEVEIYPGHYSANETSEHAREMYLTHRTKQLTALEKLETIIFGQAQPATVQASAENALQFADFMRAKSEKEAQRAAERERWQTPKPVASPVATPTPRSDLVSAPGARVSEVEEVPPAPRVVVPYVPAIPDPTRGLSLGIPPSNDVGTGDDAEYWRRRMAGATEEDARRGLSLPPVGVALKG